MLLKNDIVRYNGERYEVTGMTISVTGDELIHLRPEYGLRVIVVSRSEVELIHRAKKPEMKQCECGQHIVHGFTEGRWHSSWCPLYRQPFD